MSDQGSDSTGNQRFLVGLQSNSSPYQRSLTIDIRNQVVMDECGDQFKDSNAVMTQVKINNIDFTKGSVGSLHSGGHTAVYADEYCTVHNGSVYRVTSTLTFPGPSNEAYDPTSTPSLSDFENDIVINSSINSFKFTK